MDPALQEQLLPGLDPDEIIDGIVRFQSPFQLPEKLRVISQFGEIATVRIRRGDIRQVYEYPGIRSFKAKRVLAGINLDDQKPASVEKSAPELTEILPATGKGVVVAILDWGFDFLHNDFLDSQGNTRLIGIWDQSSRGQRMNRYGYGTMYDSTQINAAIQAPNPYETLGYHPQAGAHGTQVASIAAGRLNGYAKEADLIFVHLAANERQVNPRLNLGDSVGLLEALDYVQSLAEDRPLVINMSLGAHGGPHDGNSLVELAMDYYMSARLNTLICQSVGNYFSNGTHHQSRVLPGKKQTFAFRVNEKQRSLNELEIWYSTRDRIELILRHPESGLELGCEPGQTCKIIHEGKEAGRIYHRLNEPNSAKHHINVFLEPKAPAGRWEIELHGDKITDGRYYAWIERNGGKNVQATFEKPFTSVQSTHGTICSGYYSITTGSIGENQKPSIFSSSGPTVDGRAKPDILAPGENIVGAKAISSKPEKTHNSLKRDSGTSFSTPQVTGTIALMLQYCTKPVDCITLRSLLLEAADPIPDLVQNDQIRAGNGVLNPVKAIENMRLHQQKYSKKNQKMSNLHFESFDQSLGLQTGPQAGIVFLNPTSTNSRTLHFANTTPLSFPTLDDALRHALMRSNNSWIIKGTLFSGGPFILHELNLPLCPITPSVIRFQPASTDICCLVFDGFAAYFPSGLNNPPNRWELYPDLEAFYNQNQATQNNQRTFWLAKMIDNNQQVNQNIRIAGGSPTTSLVRQFSAPELRMVLVQFAEHLYPIRTVNGHHNGRHWVGASIHGATLTCLPVPLSEPSCYLKVISNREGKIEAINAYDGGAGISLGTVQFNAQNKALHKFLWQVWNDDPYLFTDAFTTANWSWTMIANAQGDPVLIVTPTIPTSPPFQIEAHETSRMINYLHSGNPQVGTRDVTFRATLTACFRKLVVRPHIQAIINAIAIQIYAQPALDLIHRNGIPALNLQNPSLELFQLKSALISAYVRATGCAGNLIRALRAYSSVHDKLTHLLQEVGQLSNIGTFNCSQALATRLAAQLNDARTIFNEIQRNAAQPQSPPQQPTTPSPGNATPINGTPSDTFYTDAAEWDAAPENSLWNNWYQPDSYENECNCLPEKFTPIEW